jgi:hypothetical protein
VLSRKLLSAVFVGMVMIGGCGYVPPTATVTPIINLPVYVGIPRSLLIPKIGVAATPLQQVGLNADGSPEVPDVHHPETVGWYNKGSKPGEAGPAVLLGHVNGNGKQGVFARIHELLSGDQIFVDDKTFVVTLVEKVSKQAFPGGKVYGETKDSEIRLITCGGDFDSLAHSYKDNWIVYGTLKL